MDEQNITPLTDSQREMIAAALGVIGTMAALMGIAISPEDRRESILSQGIVHSDELPENGYEIMVGLRDMVTMLTTVVGPAAVREALFDGSMPDEERAEFFPGDYDFALDVDGDLSVSYTLRSE